MLCGQFDILYASLKNLNRTVLNDEQMENFLKGHKSDDEEQNQYLISDEKFDSDEGEQEEDFDVKRAFIECVKHHQVILEFARLLEDFFRWFMLPKLFYSGSNHEMW